MVSVLARRLSGMISEARRLPPVSSEDCDDLDPRLVDTSADQAGRAFGRAFATPSSGTDASCARPAAEEDMLPRQRHRGAMAEHAGA